MLTKPDSQERPAYFKVGSISKLSEIASCKGVIMVNEDGNDMAMSKREADASVKEFGRMMDFFEGTCELCGGMRKDCSAECVEQQLATFDNSNSCDI